MQERGWAALRGYTFLVYGFVYLPIMLMGLFSLNSSDLIAFPLKGFTLEWYDIILHDQRMEHGAPLRFFGHDALTALSAAEMALRYDLLLVPVYGVRQHDGIGFDLVIEAPIPHATPEAMIRAMAMPSGRATRSMSL